MRTGEGVGYFILAAAAPGGSLTVQGHSVVNLVKRAAMLLVAASMAARGQVGGTRWDEASVGSEWELYARALAGRGLLGGEPWSARPFSPATLDRWADTLGTDHPWKARLEKPARTNGFAMLRPAVSLSDNSAFPWGMNDGAVWQGRGFNAWGTFGGTFRYGVLSARLEPTFAYAANSAFTLIPNAGNPFGSSLEPSAIDAPQRFGGKSYSLVDPGQSFVRVDVSAFAAGFSTQNIFWGPGVRQALLFDANAAGFPHVFVGSGRAISTPIGRFYGQLLYGRLEQSDQAPPSASASRFGSGLIAVWMPPSLPAEIGLARFYHRPWPSGFGRQELTAPFGSAFSDVQVFNGGTADNQLGSVFGTIRITDIGLEVFGEFGKNDRNGDLRDLEAEPEHNSAWLLGFLQSVNWSSESFWTVRAEVANGRVSPIQNLGRGQSTFYDHNLLTQGHTERGQLLGTPLIEESGGIDFSVDRWTTDGRTGFQIVERQLPGDLGVGMPSIARSRSQWDLGVTATRFRGRSDISVAVGRVWDLDRFPGVDVTNNYIRVSVRPGMAR
jgi:hypothetical protein